MPMQNNFSVIFEPTIFGLYHHWIGMSVEYFKDKELSTQVKHCIFFFAEININE